jgi:aryl-alcohol dehydrogenase-like predicted oxidoreductase
MQFGVLGFGCGAVGGLMVRGDPADQERTVARALAAGVNYFDTAAQYGNGESEKNLGRILKRLNPSAIHVGTKVRIPNDARSLADAIVQSLDTSLQRLQRTEVDVLHLHNAITVAGGGSALGVRQVLDEVVPTFESLRKLGKLRYVGITATGDTQALHEVIDSGRIDSAQVAYNMLNPSAATSLPADYPAQDYGKLLEHTSRARVGAICIRVLAGGALSGSSERHPIASAPPNPIGSARRYDDDLARAQRLAPLIKEGYAANLAEAATRFCISTPAVGTILVGIATPQQFEDALTAVKKGPLPQAALDRLAELQARFAGEPR